MMINSNKLKSRTMRRVYSIWFMKRVFPWLVAEVTVLATIVFGALSYLSFGHILNNAVIRAKYYSTSSFADFIMSAFTNADIMTLFMVGGVAFVGVLMMKDTFKLCSRALRSNFLQTPRVI
jgi:xanthine/uracil permease